jgi:hypothetical protein
MEQRSRNPRKRMAEVVYLNMQSGNGGIVVDVSRTGLGFQAACPVQPGEPMSFRFSSESLQDIEVTGDLVWTDEDRKRGGLRFGMLPVEVRQQIQRWLDEPESDVGANGQRDTFAPPRRDLPPSLHQPVARESTVESSDPGAWQGLQTPPRLNPPPARDRYSQRQAAPPPMPAESRQSGNGHADFTPVFPRRRPALSGWDDAPRSRSAAATVALTAVVAILATIAVLSILYKKQAGETFIRLGEIILGQRQEQAVDATAAAPNPAADPLSPASIPAATPKSSPAPGSADSGSSSPDHDAPSSLGAPANQAPGAPPSNAADTTASSPNNTSAPGPAQGAAADSDSAAPATGSRRPAGVAPAAPKPSSRPAQDQSDGRTELALAQDYLSRGTPKSREVAMQLLWVAVGNGNTEAEVELADLYLSGESRNCTQARILLRAAADSGNFTAGQKLEQLPHYGCR